jgi:predicted transcriptional regulator
MRNAIYPIRLSPDDKEKLLQLAAAEQRTVPDALRLCIRREAARRAALAARRAKRKAA